MKLITRIQTACINGLKYLQNLQTEQQYLRRLRKDAAQRAFPVHIE